MKLDYKILWLDDKIQDFIEDEYIEEIENHLTELGFIPRIVTVSSSTDFFEKLDDSYDLILTDYHMNDMNGDEVVQAIRGTEHAVMTEILFYTAKADLKDTQKISRVSFLETNSTTSSHSESVVLFTKQLIDLTIRKFQHIVSMRGMIMHETSSLDIEIGNILKIIIHKGDSDNIIQTIKMKYLRSSSEFAKEIENTTDTDKILYNIGADHRVRAVQRNIEKSEIKSILNSYTTEVISIRNKFAHAELMSNENGTQYFKHGESGLEFNEELCKKIRTDINKHKNNLDHLKLTLGE